MTLSRGTQFNAYLIGNSIGVGGMGEVYRATDTKLKRDVAIKVLPESLAADAERLARFQREAELLASLNHTNIAQIFGLEKAEGVTALVMELIEGPTLAERIELGPIPPDEALNIALQIASALEAAHGRGIIHRDLKPANIKLKPDGSVKVLDFGIAKALEAPGNSGPVSPVLTTPAMTMSGVILGTAAYMSPEQARGLTVDERADIWAFGCVLYEMLTGQPVFGGEDITTTLARVLERELDFSALPATLSPAVRHTIKLCLRKDPKKRIRHISDVRLALDGEFESGSTHAGIAGNTLAVQPGFWRRALPLAGALIVGALVTGVVLWLALQPQAQPVSRFAYDLPDTHVLRNVGRNVLALAPDGRHFAYNTTSGIMVRDMDLLEARLLPGTGESVTNPFFSTDSRSLAYFESGLLKRINISGGAPVTIAEVPVNLYGAYWAPDNMIFYGQPSGIFRVPAAGGTPELVVEANGEQVASPELLPDGDTLLFTVAKGANWDAGQTVAQSLSTGVRTVLIEGGSDAHYLPTGHLIYTLGSGLFAVAFDASTRSVTSGAVPLVQDVRRATLTASANYGVSAKGTLVYMVGSAANQLRNLLWVDRAGLETAIPIEPGAYAYPRIAPDGKRVALEERNTDEALWIWDFAGETRTRLTLGEGGGEYPTWTPDSARIAYFNPVTRSIDWKAANNTGQVETLLTPDMTQRTNISGLDPYFFTASGQELVFRSRSTTGGGEDIGMITFGGTAEPVWLLSEAFPERNAVLSPDGRWLAYQSSESGRHEVYVRPFPNVNDDLVQVSNTGGFKPLWSPDGRELFYLDETRSPAQLMSVTVDTSAATFAFSARSKVLDWPYFLAADGRTYDVSVDGQRFLALQNVGNADNNDTTTRIIITENWLEELERLMPE